MGKIVRKYARAVKTLENSEHGPRYDLVRMEQALNLLGHTEQKLKFAHVAGTNGKGSVCYLLERILRESGYKTGMYISPHIVNYRERIQVNGKFITENEFADVFEKIAKLNQTFGLKLSPFEHVTLMAFEEFKRKKCDIAILETGLGGRLDATNVVIPEMSVITNVGLEHQDVLGKTLEKITREKAGIVKAGVPVITGEQNSKALHEIRKKCRKENAKLSVLGKNFKVKQIMQNVHSQIIEFNQGKKHWKGLKLKMIGSHQTTNAGLAIATALELTRNGWNIAEPAIRNALAVTQNPARMEILNERPFTLVDCAHNAHGMKALSKTLNELGIMSTECVIGVCKDKDWKSMVKAIAPYCGKVYCTQAKTERALSPKELVREFKKFGINAIAIENPKKAFMEAQHNRRHRPVLITGSCYLASEIYNR